MWRKGGEYENVDVRIMSRNIFLILVVFSTTSPFPVNQCDTRTWKDTRMCIIVYKTDENTGDCIWNYILYRENRTMKYFISN